MKIIATIILLSVFAFSCKHDEATSIRIDVTQAKEIVVEPSRLTSLEASDSSMLYDICNLAVIDNKFIVHSRDLLRVFDAQSGKFLNNVARHGKGPKDFSYISNLWSSKDTIIIYDCNLDKFLRFDVTGNLLSSQAFSSVPYRPGERPRTVIPSPDGIGYFAVNSFTDNTTESNPLLTYYVNKGDSYSIKGRSVGEGAFMADGVYSDVSCKRLLVWEPLRDTIFTVSHGEVRPLYAVDFGENAMNIGSQNLKHMNERLQALLEAPGLRASFIRYVQSKDRQLYFTFVTNERKWNLAVADEASGKSKIYHFRNDSGSLQQGSFFKICNDTLYIEMSHREEIENNPALYRINVKNLD